MDEEQEMQKDLENRVEAYDQLIVNEIKKLMTLLKESYAYVDTPTWQNVEEMKASEFERREHVKGKLDDMKEYIDNGVFW